MQPGHPLLNHIEKSLKVVYDLFDWLWQRFACFVGKDGAQGRANRLAVVNGKQLGGSIGTIGIGIEGGVSRGRKDAKGKR